MSKPAPSPFSSNIPNFQIAWDSTSLGWAKTCLRYYKFTMLEGWTTRSRSIHLHFGSLYASGNELYAKLRASGTAHDAAVLAVVRETLEASGTRDEDDTFSPWPSDDPYKNTYTLIRTLVWNLDERQTSTFSTYIRPNGHPAVELSFNFSAFELDGETISLSGHLDEVVSADDRLWVRDDKTTKGALNAHYRQSYSPDNQMSLYSIAGKVILNEPVAGVLVRAAQIGVGFSRFMTFQVPRPQPVLDEWMADTKYYISLAREAAITGHYPANDKACGNYGGCAFQKVCSVSPAHRDSWLNSDFIKQTPWNPLKARSV